MKLNWWQFSQKNAFENLLILKIQSQVFWHENIKNICEISKIPLQIFDCFWIDCFWLWKHAALFYLIWNSYLNDIRFEASWIYSRIIIKVTRSIINRKFIPSSIKIAIISRSIKRWAKNRVCGMVFKVPTNDLVIWLFKNPCLVSKNLLFAVK